MKTKNQTTVWWRYVLLLMLLLLAKPSSQFINQALRGHPLDINYFWSELSPDKILNFGLYNGEGGKDWKIGKPKATIWTAEQSRSLSELRQFALELVNRDRTINNLTSLNEDTILSQAAQRHAQDMLERQYFDHLTPEGKNPRDRYLASGGNPRLGIGENIVKSTVSGLGLTYGEAEKFQRGWMYSNGHRQNLLTAEYTKFGYGIVTRTDGRIYAVQMFAY
ncbi:CAP domain-containing protein [Fortiea contorta]|uniref:CAP domain-containing protein n=1 Tax=Fortiea contorta TaxID=1892405 RepID=UPI00034A42E7|nr:CAP domain-containing protein [Fortiea contorta]